MTTVSFPSLGLGEFKINPVAFTIPIGSGIQVRWYALLITTGIILAFVYAYFRTKEAGISFDDLIDITLFTVIFAIVGARFYYVITSLDQYDTFWEMIAIWNGGIAIYGAVIAGAITIFTVCKIKKYSTAKTLKMFDCAAPAVMIGQIIGRWGNFCNGEAYGAIVPEGHPLYFLRMGLISGNTVSDFRTSTMVYVHPTFLYESLWNLIGFGLINLLYKKKKFDGQIVLMYLTWYGFGRMFIEGLRTDSLYVGIFRISQVVGFLCFIICGILLTVFFIKAYKKKKALASEVSDIGIAESEVQSVNAGIDADGLREYPNEVNENENKNNGENEENGKDN